MGLNPRQDIGNVGLVHGRESKALLAKVVEGCAYMDKRRLVYDKESVMELGRFLDRERIAVLRVESCHIDGMKKVLAHVLHHENRTHRISDRRRTPSVEETSCPASHRE